MSTDGYSSRGNEPKLKPKSMVIHRKKSPTLEPKPCEIPCPKCGSADIGRKFTAKGEVIRSTSYGEPPNQYLTGAGTYHWTSTQDHIHNHCRSCQYGWATLPLKTIAKNGKGRR